MPLQVASAQNTEPPEGAIITSAQVSGLDLARLSPGLQAEIAKLAGAPLDREFLKELAARIEAEHPRYVAGVRVIQAPGGEVHVIFVAARPGDRTRQGNVNDRYVIEHVEIVGVPDSQISQALRDDLQSLVGRRLESEEAERLEDRIERALPRYDVTRRIVRGSQPGQIRLVYEAHKKETARWLHFRPAQSNVVYHSDQGWGSFLDLPISGRDLRFTPIVAIDNGDDLIEEYSGFGLRFETRKLFTERLGASLEWTTFDQTWRDATLSALAVNPQIPRLYETRSTVTPLVAFAFTPELSLTAGVSITELEPLSGAPGSEMANAAIASIVFGREWHAAGATHDLNAIVGLRAGTRALESELAYTRYLGQGSYRYGHGRHSVLLKGMAGSITGAAPLFERFSLGDSQTLRGWDKYDVAPAGGDRMVYASVEYQFSGLALFLDSGSVWDRNNDSHFRVATGLGFHPGPVFFDVGFPLNTDNMSAVFTMGIRVSSVRIQR